MTDTPIWSGEAITKLPFQVRPIAGEGGHSFIARLARANHLQPRYLRKYLLDPPGHRGTPSWTRLAAVTCRDPELLRQTLEAAKCKECGDAMPVSTVFGRPAMYCSSRCRTRVSRTRFTTAPCRICQEPMQIRVGQRHRLCSSFCRRTAYLMRRRGDADVETKQPTDRACEWCESPLPPDAHSLRRTCSASCGQQVRRWNRRAEKSEPPLNPPACGFCGNTIQRSRSLAGPPRRWCSRACMMRASRGLDPATFLEPLTCQHCQTQFPRGPSNRSRRWCSPRCHQRAQRAVREG
ncbi:TniQ family protein [Streptomyces sp. NPDC058691]|uniref:TniQ family protein n=1 Tax=Streptomyces sp. NPDC058691 TaxID=3346601 RepID=UPI00364913E8